MQEKEMVNDILSTVNSSITKYSSMISECNNDQLRQTLQTLRSGDERFQQDLYKMASQKGYYKPAGQASQQQIQEVKTQLTQG